VLTETILCRTNTEKVLRLVINKQTILTPIGNDEVATYLCRDAFSSSKRAEELDRVLILEKGLKDS
jgi:hypothetical protein